MNAPKLILIMGLAAMLLGCSTTRQKNVMIIPADRYQYSMTNEIGVVGWFVPNAVMIDYQEALVKLEYYKNKE